MRKKVRLDDLPSTFKNYFHAKFEKNATLCSYFTPQLNILGKKFGVLASQKRGFCWNNRKKTPKGRMTPSYKNQKPFCQGIIRNMLYFSETRGKMDNNEKKNF